MQPPATNETFVQMPALGLPPLQPGADRFQNSRERLQRMSDLASSVLISPGRPASTTIRNVDVDARDRDVLESPLQHKTGIRAPMSSRAGILAPLVRRAVVAPNGPPRVTNVMDPELEACAEKALRGALKDELSLEGAFQISRREVERCNGRPHRVIFHITFKNSAIEASDIRRVLSKIYQAPEYDIDFRVQLEDDAAEIQTEKALESVCASFFEDQPELARDCSLFDSIPEGVQNGRVSISIDFSDSSLSKRDSQRLLSKIRLLPEHERLFVIVSPLVEEHVPRLDGSCNPQTSLIKFVSSAQTFVTARLLNIGQQQQLMYQSRQLITLAKQHLESIARVMRQSLNQGIFPATLFEVHVIAMRLGQEGPSSLTLRINFPPKSLLSMNDKVRIVREIYKESQGLPFSILVGDDDVVIASAAEVLEEFEEEYIRDNPLLSNTLLFDFESKGKERGVTRLLLNFNKNLQKKRIKGILEGIQQTLEYGQLFVVRQQTDGLLDQIARKINPKLAWTLFKHTMIKIPGRAPILSLDFTGTPLDAKGIQGVLLEVVSSREYNEELFTIGKLFLKGTAIDTHFLMSSQLEGLQKTIYHLDLSGLALAKSDLQNLTKFRALRHLNLTECRLEGHPISWDDMDDNQFPRTAIVLGGEA